MEAFPAADIEQFKYIRQVIDECDYYILVIGDRYGSVDKAGISYTEREYHYAVETGKVVLAFIHGNPSTIPSGKIDIDPLLRDRLDRFKKKITDERLVKNWHNNDELRAQIIVALTLAMKQSPAPGWVRGDAVASEDLLAQINSIRIENDRLQAELLKLSKPRSAYAIDDLAPLDQMFSFHYEITTDGYQGTKLTRYEIDLPWSEIFCAVALRLNKPTGSSYIGIYLRDYLRDNYEVSEDATLILSEIHVIRVQLVAHGLISQDEKTGSISLTEKGRLELARTVGVKTVSIAKAPEKKRLGKNKPKAASK